MTREELSSKKTKGDLIACAKVLRISTLVARKTWARPRSKRYPALAAALESIIMHREELENALHNDESKISE